MHTDRVSPAKPLKPVTRSLAALAASLVALLIGGCSTQAPMATAAPVDLTRYLGDWYEIAVIPNFFQAMCVADTKARYRLKADGSGDIEVHNRCRKADGQIASATGVARVVADSGNAQLRVSFFRPFWGDYWMLALDRDAPDYRWVLVGEPGRTYAWVLSRTPTLPAADLDAALARAVALGYARSAFTRTPQTQPITD
ncbi:MAG: lipocalin family protein [Leptothrix sp. (in: b-proteobacteria)]